MRRQPSLNAAILVAALVTFAVTISFATPVANAAAWYSCCPYGVTCTNVIRPGGGPVGGSWYCCCIGVGTAAWSSQATPCVYPMLVSSCTNAGATYLRDQMSASCAYQDSNYCRSAGSYAGCTAAAECDGRNSNTPWNVSTTCNWCTSACAYGSSSIADTCDANTLNVGKACIVGGTGAGTTYTCSAASHTNCQSQTCGGVTYRCTYGSSTWQWRTSYPPEVCGDGVDNDCNPATSDVCPTTSTTTTTLPCNLQTASIATNCAAGASVDCEAGETVAMSGTYTGDCSAADFFQIDANDGGGCVLEYSIPPAVMSGISDSSITLSGGTVSNAAWTVPAIADACKGKTVNAVAARLWHGLPGGAGPSYLAGGASGSFKFATVSPTTTTITPPPGCNPSPCVPFTLTMKPGWNLISLPYSYVDSVTQDGCGATHGNFYFYNATNGKWNVQTVGIASLKKATSYWFHSDSYCAVTVDASGDVAEGDLSLAKNEWNNVGAPKGVMNQGQLQNVRCPSCGGNQRCASMVVKYYDTASGQFKSATTLQEGVGYMIMCTGT